MLSRAGVSETARADYVRRLSSAFLSVRPAFRTIYFGGGSPALCDLRPLFEALAPCIGSETEFTVELHPLDVTEELLQTLKAGGVNRISMGVQSLDDAILADMGRGYALMEAERSFQLVKRYFDNAGIDLIVGYPGETAALLPRHARLAKWGLRHCSVYSLIVEEKSILAHRLKNAAAGTMARPDDETTMNRLAVVSRFLAGLGLERYEISNYAVPGYECRHNLAVWRGEDYLGLGEGACGRVGLRRTRDAMTLVPTDADEVLSPARDRVERAIFRLRTREGIETAAFPKWRGVLDGFVREGLLTGEGTVYRLTERGGEVCDSILAELVE